MVTSIGIYTFRLLKLAARMAYSIRKPVMIGSTSQKFTRYRLAYRRYQWLSLCLAFIEIELVASRSFSSHIHTPIMQANNRVSKLPNTKNLVMLVSV